MFSWRNLLSSANFKALTSVTLLLTIMCAILMRKAHPTERVVSSKCASLPHIIRNSSSFVSLCQSRRHGGHRIGNHLYLLAAVVYVAEKTNRSILMHSNGYLLDNVFQFDCFRRFDDRKSGLPEPSIHLGLASRYYQSFDDRFTENNGVTEVQKMKAKTLSLCGIYQTSLYASLCEPTLRSLLQFKPEVHSAAGNFLKAVNPTKWYSASYFRVGVHVRRGDFLKASEVNYGLTTVDESYIKKAMQYFIQKHTSLQFIFASDDLEWVEKAIQHIYNVSSFQNNELSLKINSSTVYMALSKNNSAAVDLAILSKCDAVIMSTGSYGWWAAWIANKPTIYYEKWPLPHSSLASISDSITFFPKHWIPMK